MPTTKPFLEKLLQESLGRLAEIESDETIPLLVRLETCVKECHESLKEVRKLVIDQSFDDQTTEIYFFKSVKPLIMARYLFFQKVFRLQKSYHMGCGTLEKERLSLEMKEIVDFFESNLSFYDYYLIGDTHYDELYFVRGQHDWKISEDTHHFDEQFSTSKDGKLAELLAYELLLKYVDKLLNPPPLREINTPCIQASSSLKCTATTANIVELGYALYASGFFNRGDASIKEIMDFLSKALQVNLHKYYDTFVQIRERKINPTKYLDELKNNLAKYIDKDSY